MKNKAIIYTRVSTDKQETERQIRDLKEYCDKNNYEIVDIISETISATKKISERKHLIDRVKKSKADFLVVQDIARFSRNVRTGLELKDCLHDIGVSLVVASTNIKSLNDDGTENPIASMLFTMLMSVFQTENITKRNNIKSGLRNAKSKGVVLGRRVGYKEDLTIKYKDIVAELKRGESIRRTVLILNKKYSQGVVQRVSKQLKEKSLLLDK